VELKVDVVGAGAFTPQMVVDSLSGTLAATGLEASSIDHCLIPEGNAAWMTDSLKAADLETPEWTELKPRVFDSLATTGACGCAAVPLFAAEAFDNGRFSAGDRVMMIGVEATKWIWAGEVIDWTATKE
jgi:3-oxoacyl-[acyl-carrier-protein] synthase-3